MLIYDNHIDYQFICSFDIYVYMIKQYLQKIKKPFRRDEV